MKRSTLWAAMLFLLACGWSTRLIAQCPSNQVQVAIVIVPDNYPTETSWELREANSNTLLASASNALGDTVCVDTGACLRFTIFDSFGDGICCAYGNGSYTVSYGGNVVASGGQFTTQEVTLFGNCAAGSDCSFADSVGVGSHVASHHDFWYYWVPDSTGTYEISTLQAPIPATLSSGCTTIVQACFGTIRTKARSSTMTMIVASKLASRATLPLVRATGSASVTWAAAAPATSTGRSLTWARLSDAWTPMPAITIHWPRFLTPVTIPGTRSAPRGRTSWSCSPRS
ncbi:MAG: hypothetical protein U0176_16385 [Bacteroidia bacterium]